jgi:hypothetical protein
MVGRVNYPMQYESLLAAGSNVVGVWLGVVLPFKEDNDTNTFLLASGWAHQLV